MKFTIKSFEEYKSLIAKGYTTQQIADELNIGVSSVKRHLRSLGLQTQHYKPINRISKDILIAALDRHLSTQQIADELNDNLTHVKYWMKQYGLAATHRRNIRKEINDGYKTCPKCNVRKSLTRDNFYIRKNGKFHCWCKECNNRITYEKQCQLKIDAMEYKGGKCCLCGYNKCKGALDFHHIDPEKKEFAIGSLRAYRWDIVKPELDKCILVCKNCHAEIHAKMVDPVGIVPTSSDL
jgi:predicted transcriptional regulator